jgi:putative membrane protein
MRLAAQLLTALVAFEHLWFLVLEMILWTRPLGRKTFGTTAEFAAETAPMMMNQGLYNGFLAAGLVYGLATGDVTMVRFFLACVIVAGLFGAVTVKPAIAVVQALPAALALGLSLAAR